MITYSQNDDLDCKDRDCPWYDPFDNRCTAWECDGKDYRLKFKGSRTGSYLTIEKANGYTVPVAVWWVSDADIVSLDRYEGYPHFYYKRTIVLPCSDGKRHRCFVYIMHEDRPLGIPSRYYVETCAQGYESFGFDDQYLADAVNYSLKRCAG